MSGGNTIVEGLIIFGMAAFFYIWAANAAPFTGIASGVCGVGNTFGLQSSDCDRIQANEAIIQGAPAIAVIIGIFGLVAVVTGIMQIIYSRKIAKDKEKQIKL